MKLFRILSVILLVAPISPVSCQSQNETFIAEETAKIPLCGLSCLEKTIPAVGCELLNLTCICPSQRLIKITAQCLLAKCTLEESVEVDKVQAALCERPYQSRNHLIRVISIVTAVFSYTVISLRLATRYFLHQKYRWDDFFIIAAAGADAVFLNFGVEFEHHGFGEHTWEIDINIIPQLLYWFYICEMFYIITISLIKVSILIFYLQVFPSRSFRIQCWSVMAFCVGSSFAFTIVTIFQCHPVSYVWDKNQSRGHCINFNSVTWANGGLNILQDVLIVALPISEVRKLQLGQKRKIGLYVMFGLGAFVCIISMIRLNSVKGFGLTADPTWDNVPITIWSTLETSIALICTCLPTLRAGLLHFFPRFLGSVSNQSNPINTDPAIHVIIKRQSFGTSSTRELTSISSFRIAEEGENTNSDQPIQGLELAKLNSGRPRDESLSTFLKS